MKNTKRTLWLSRDRTNRGCYNIHPKKPNKEVFEGLGSKDYYCVGMYDTNLCSDKFEKVMGKVLIRGEIKKVIISITEVKE